MKLKTSFLFALFVLVQGAALFADPLTAPADRYNLQDWEKFRDFPSLYPYLHEFSYRALADHVIDPNSRTFDPKAVKPGDSIYCGVWYLDWFVQKVHDHIPSPYLLITCDVGSWLPSPNHFKLIYDPKVVYWFGKNMLFTNHPKLFQLPMGQFYSLWVSKIVQSHAVDHLNHLVFSSPKKKDIFLYLNYTERDHGRRIAVADTFATRPYCFNRNRPPQRVTFTQFWDELARSKFVLSPLGLEIDCTRTWECFALGAIPIVEHSFLDPLYKDLPLLLVHDWKHINKQFLDQKYDEISSKEYDLRPVFIDYWADVIREKQHAIRSGDVSAGALESTLFSSTDLAEIKSILSNQASEPFVLIYQGSLTCLRPFQVAKTLKPTQHIHVIDLWAQNGRYMLKKHTQSPALLAAPHVELAFASQRKALFKTSQKKAVFLDLTHFRHKLLIDFASMVDFLHSLEKDIVNTYHLLNQDDLLFGNMASDPYVSEVIERLQRSKELGIHVSHACWYCVKK